MTKYNEISSESVILAAVKANGKRTPPRAEYTVADGRGLMLVVKEKEKGQRTFTWRFQYKRPASGRTNNLTFGTYFLGGGGVGIGEARNRAQEARETIAAGVDPAEERNQARAVAVAAVAADDVARDRKRAGLAALGTFRAEAEDWVEYKRGTIADRTLDNYAAGLELHVYPVIGSMALGEIRNLHLRPVVEKLTKAGTFEAMNEVLNRTWAIMERAKDNGRIEFNPISRMSPEAKKQRTAKKGHHAAVIEPKKIGDVMKKIRDNSRTQYSREVALIAAYTMQRVGSIIAMRWSDIDMETATWTIPVEFMKMSRALRESGNAQSHIVPLAHQVVTLLRLWKASQTRVSPWVFPHRDDVSKFGSTNAPSTMLRSLGLGGTQSMHGFRSTGRTAGEYFAGQSGLMLEAQLAHKQGGSTQAQAATSNMPGVYLKTEQFLRLEAQLAARRAMAQEYADFLDGTGENTDAIRIAA